MTPQIRAAEPSAIKVLTSHSSFTVLDTLASAFEQATGQQVAVEADSAKTMLARIKGGETADVLVIGKSAADELAQLGIVVSGSRRAFARARVGIAVRAGASRPDISSVEAFRQQIVELLAVPGVELVGPLPDEIQKVFETSAAVFTASKRSTAAEALLQFLLAPARASVFREKGLEQVGVMGNGCIND